MSEIETAQLQVQRALQLASHAKADRIRAQAALLACIAKEDQAAKQAKKAAERFSAIVRHQNDEIRGVA